MSLFLATDTRAQSLTASNLNEIIFEQKLNASVSLDLAFRDEAGKPVTLGDYFDGKPVILVLGYYRCPMLCTLTLNGLVEAMEDMRWVAGKEFTIINISIDPSETSVLASAKKKAYLKRYGRAGAAAGWHFLTGDSKAIQTVSQEVGFRYQYDPEVRQYAHPSGVVILTPQGRVSKYLFGVTFSPTELFVGLKSASQEQIGTRIERLLLLCFHYSPIHGKYGEAVMLTVRILGGLTLVGLGGFYFSLWRRSAPKDAASQASEQVGASCDSIVESKSPL